MQPTIKIYFCFFFTSRWSLSITSIMCLRHDMLSSLFLPFKVIQYFLASEHINSLNIYKWAMVLCYKVSRPFRQLHSTYSQHVNKAKIRYVCIWHLITISKLYGSICFRFVIGEYFWVEVFHGHYEQLYFELSFCRNVTYIFNPVYKNTHFAYHCHHTFYTNNSHQSYATILGLIMRPWYYWNIWYIILSNVTNSPHDTIYLVCLTKRWYKCYRWSMDDE